MFLSDRLQRLVVPIGASWPYLPVVPFIPEGVYGESCENTLWGACAPHPSSLLGLNFGSAHVAACDSEDISRRGMANSPIYRPEVSRATPCSGRFPSVSRRDGPSDDCGDPLKERRHRGTASARTPIPRNAGGFAGIALRPRTGVRRSERRDHGPAQGWVPIASASARMPPSPPPRSAFAAGSPVRPAPRGRWACRLTSDHHDNADPRDTAGRTVS